MKSFRDPATNVLRSYGYAESNGADLARDEPDDFNLESGKWALVGDEWIPVPPDPNVAINAEINRLLDGEYKGNRGSLQTEVYLLEKEAREYSEIYGLSMELILSGNSYYPQIKALDLQISALKEQLT